MPDYLEQFGKRIMSWDGQPIGNRQTAFFIYELTRVLGLVTLVLVIIGIVVALVGLVS